jgi:hypothetical protein
VSHGWHRHVRNLKCMFMHSCLASKLHSCFPCCTLTAESALCVCRACTCLFPYALCSCLLCRANYHLRVPATSLPTSRGHAESLRAASPRAAVSTHARGPPRCHPHAHPCMPHFSSNPWIPLVPLWMIVDQPVICGGQTTWLSILTLTLCNEGQGKSGKPRLSDDFSGSFASGWPQQLTASYALEMLFCVSSHVLPASGS